MDKVSKPKAQSAMLLWLSRQGVVTLCAVVALVALLPSLGLQPANTRLIILACLLALITSGMNLSFGYAGELAILGAAVYGATAYVTAYLALYVYNDLLLSLAVSVVLSLLLGLITGLPGLRLGGWTLTVASVFPVLLLPVVINLLGPKWGGYSGLSAIPLAKILGHEVSPEDYYYVVIAVTGLWFLFFRNLVRSRHGAALLVLRESPILATSLGMSTYRLRLTAYAIGAVPAGLAGTLYAYLDSFIAPETFGLNLAITVFAACVLGGATSVYGAALGAAFLQFGPMRSGVFQDYALIAYGVILVAGGVLFEGGIAALVRSLLHKLGWPTAATKVDENGDLLRFRKGERLLVEDLEKSFGGVKAVAGISFTAEPGSVTGLIGPNGSGKTTLLNLISGFYRPDAGRVSLGAQQLSGQTVHSIARKGVGRTFQTPIMPDGLSVREVLATANYTRSRSSLLSSAFRTPHHRRVTRTDNDIVDAVLRTFGLTWAADREANSLPLGTRRLVELGRALVGGSGLLLLDEVAAGLDESEIEELISVLHRLRDAGATVVLVEHNFGLVKSVSDKIVVLANGRSIAQGTPAEVEADPDVLESYLGEGAGVTGTRHVDRPEPGTERAGQSALTDAKGR